MNDRQFRYFIAVAQELSFSKAARRLNVSQPPLSMQIKALEDELGTPLLLRTKRSVELTQAGAIFLEKAIRAIAEMDDACLWARLAARGETGVLRVGFTSSVPMLEIFPRMLREFRQTYPNVKVELQHMSSGLQLRALTTNQLDVGILRPPSRQHDERGLELHDFWYDRLAVFLPQDHPLAGDKGPLSVAALAPWPFVAVNSSAGCGVRDHIVTRCALAGFQPDIVQEANELSTVLGLVAAGIGVTILPECYQRVDTYGVVHRSLTEEESRSRFLLALRASPSERIAQNFLKMAQSIRPVLESAPKSSEKAAAWVARAGATTPAASTH